LLVLFSRLWRLFFRSKGSVVQAFTASVAIIFVVNVAVLAAGLVVFGHDGKMASYAAMVLGAALALTALERKKR
jgi:predicted membrane chloride channel (bestrophin family)